MQGLVLDFDGVISDSAPEAFEVALRTTVLLHPETPLVRHERAELYRRFLALMPLGNRAEDFGVALQAIEAGAALPDQAAYDAFYAGLPPERLRAFHRCFYSVRRAFRSAEPARWRSLIGPYPAFLALLRRRASVTQLAIATAKDRHSVGMLLEDYGVRDLFPEGRVLDKETGVSKAAHLAHLQAEFGRPFEAITFVDDKVNHLDSVAPLGVRCVLAAWGYNGPREHRLARQHGHAVCTLADAEALLFGAGESGALP